MTDNLTRPLFADAVEAIRTLPCTICWAGTGGALGEACGIIPEGDHFARWCAARKASLITADQLGAAMDTLREITDRALVETAPAAGPAETVTALVSALGAVWSPDFGAYASGQLPIEQVRCALCTHCPCDCPPFGTPEYFALIDARHGRGGAK